MEFWIAIFKGVLLSRGILIQRLWSTMQLHLHVSNLDNNYWMHLTTIVHLNVQLLVSVNGVHVQSMRCSLQ